MDNNNKIPYEGGLSPLKRKSIFAKAFDPINKNFLVANMDKCFEENKGNKIIYNYK